MNNTDLTQLAELLEDYLAASPFEMGSDEDRALAAALQVINEQL